ncbi:MAG: ribonuclease HIII [Kiritimatiellae bacterium]|nr:ribonuclease HIII [Kiritimatiellia bacterium]
MTTSMTTFTQKMSAGAQDRLIRHLREDHYELRDVAHAVIAGKKEGLNLVLYESGKLVVQGKNTAEWVEFIFEPFILEALLNAPAQSDDGKTLPPRIGIDESGKGDFFGPLVVAGFLLTPDIEPLLRDLGVKDSKQIKNDVQIQKIAHALHARAPRQCKVITLMPETYNRLVKRMGTVNRLLAWGHASVLEELLTRFPDITQAVADQFGPEHQIKNALKTRGKKIELIQRHKAESDPAVAAASILARSGFVDAMKTLSDLAGAPLPKGATHVRPTAETLVKQKGPDILEQIAKTHFRTTRQVLEACGLS